MVVSGSLLEDRRVLQPLQQKSPPASHDGVIHFTLVEPLHGRDVVTTK